jgi:hypothetical protein
MHRHFDEEHMNVCKTCMAIFVSYDLGPCHTLQLILRNHDP